MARQKSAVDALLMCFSGSLVPAQARQKVTKNQRKTRAVGDGALFLQAHSVRP
jgi:hypothetical protein